MLDSRLGATARMSIVDLFESLFDSSLDLVLGMVLDLLHGSLSSEHKLELISSSLGNNSSSLGLLLGKGSSCLSFHLFNLVMSFQDGLVRLDDFLSSLERLL